MCVCVCVCVCVHTEAIDDNSEEIAGTSGSCHGDLMHERGTVALVYAKLMQTTIL